MKIKFFSNTNTALLEFTDTFQQIEKKGLGKLTIA